MGEKGGLPMMPWYPGDFMRSTRGWSVTAKGVYRELLDAQWDMNILPTNPEHLRQLIGASEQEWAESWPLCEDKFPERYGKRANVRLEEHRLKSKQLSNVRSTAGRKGGQASAEAKSKQKSTFAQANFNHPSPSPSPSPSPEPNHTQNQPAATPESVPRRAFEAIRNAYPKGLHRGDHWLLAEREIGKRLEEGISAARLLEATEAYAAQQLAMGTVGTEKVLRPSNFFNGTGAWKGPFPKPVQAVPKTDKVTWTPTE